jgi:carboxymethylenebutenolidase
MKKIKKEDLKQEVYDLFDSYVHSKIDRRKFIDKLSIYAVGGLTVTSIMAFLLPKYAQAQKVKMNDPRLKSEYVGYESPNGAGKMQGLLTRPANNTKKLSGIIVVQAVTREMMMMEEPCSGNGIGMKCWRIL